MPFDRYGHCHLGVDYSVPPHELPLLALADARNVLPSRSGLPQGRSGSVKQNAVSLASRITSFFEHRSGTTRNKLCSYSTKIAWYNSATGEFEDQITGLTDDALYQWVNFAGKAIGVNGADAPQYFTDTSTSGDLADSPPVGVSIAEWSNRVWIGGDTTNVATLTGSKLDDPTDWSSSDANIGYVSQVVGDSEDPITGIFPYFDMLLIGKRNNLYKLTGAPATDAETLALAPLYSKSSDNIGFTSKYAITQVGNDVIFLDGFDIKRLSGIQEYGDVAHTTVIPHLREYLESVGDADYIQNTQFFHYKTEQQIWVSLPTGADTHFVFVLDYKFKEKTGRYSFYPMYNLEVACFGGVENGEIVDIYYGDETGFVRQLNTGNSDDGAAIDRYIVKVVSGNVYGTEGAANDITHAHEYRKQFQTAETFILPSESALTMTPYYALDLFNSEQIRTSGNYTALDAEVVTGWDGTGVKHKRLRFFGLSGRTLALKWVHSAVNQNFTLYPSEIHYEWKSKNLVT